VLEGDVGDVKLSATRPLLRRADVALGGELARWRHDDHAVGVLDEPVDEALDVVDAGVDDPTLGFGRGERA